MDELKNEIITLINSITDYEKLKIIVRFIKRYLSQALAQLFLLLAAFSAIFSSNAHSSTSRSAKASISLFLKDSSSSFSISAAKSVIFSLLVFSLSGSPIPFNNHSMLTQCVSHISLRTLSVADTAPVSILPRLEREILIDLANSSCVICKISFLRKRILSYNFKQNHQLSFF